MVQTIVLSKGRLSKRADTTVSKEFNKISA
jgi:hypothetical protein